MTFRIKDRFEYIISPFNNVSIDKKAQNQRKTGPGPDSGRGTS